MPGHLFNLKFTQFGYSLTSCELRWFNPPIMSGPAKPWPVLLMVRELGIGGIERDVTKIAIALDRSRFEPHVGCFCAEGFRYSELCRANVPIIELPVSSFLSPALMWRAGGIFRDYLRQHGIHLVHSYDVPTTEFGVPLARLWRTQAVVSSQLGYRSMFTRFERMVLRATDSMVDRVVVNCEAMRRHMVDGEGISPERVYLCYNGVDTRVFFAAKQPKPAALAGAELVVGTICALRREKRVDLLLSAFARVCHLRPGLKMLVVGSGPLLQDLQTQAALLGIGDFCVFEPATGDVSNWMRAIDIFGLPSDSEAFSNALLEAMASGCCPIGSRVGGTPELIEHERTGLLFEPGNVEDLSAMLAAVITDSARREAMAGAAAVKARNEFSIERAAATMGELYASLLNGSVVIEG
jgi:L-malate glycosyltransferase